MMSQTCSIGHRAHTVYVGLHVPGYRRRGHRHHRHHHKNGHKATGAANGSDQKRPVTPPSERVHFILGEEEDGAHESHPLFSEMEELHGEGDDMEWRETARIVVLPVCVTPYVVELRVQMCVESRWIKFEEDVEEGGNRWSKPHVATISLHSLFELRSCILNGTVMLDLEATNLEQIIDLILENMVNSGQLKTELRLQVKETLLLRHRHQHERRHDSSRLPLIRSLAEIGRNSSKGMFGSSHSPPTNLDGTMTKSPSSTSLHLTAPHSQFAPTENNSSSSADLQHKTLWADTEVVQLNQAFMRKIPPGSEASNILIGEVSYLENTIMAFIRLNVGLNLGDLTEVPVPTRFLFVLLGPQGNIGRYHEIGRAMATLLSDEVFHEIAYKARNRLDLMAGVDEFLDAVTVLPPGAWDPNIRIEPPQQIPSQDARKKAEPLENKLETEEDEEKQREESGLKRTGRLFGGLINDLRRKIPWYLSDFKDALALQSIASIFFLYFACLTPIITFGGLLGKATDNYIAAMESLLSGCICGVLYGLFSGQPLTILGSTGPVLVFETILFDFCKDKNLDYMTLRLYIGMWTALVLLILVAFDASALVCYITRFTEENFATLISVIFIIKAVENVLEIGHKYPMSIYETPALCQCLPPNNITSPEVSWESLTATRCQSLNGTVLACLPPDHPVKPDVFLFAILLFIFTFALSIFLKDFKFSTFFPTKVRAVISDFAVVISIVLMTLVDNRVGLPTPKLEVPREFKPTRYPARGWVIPWHHEKNPWYVAVLAIIPAMLATILIFMDQQITAVIINRKENKLKKGGGYHLDLFVLAILIAICSVLGLPWFVAATVLAMTHVNSLKMESECSAPRGEAAVLGSPVCIFLLVGCSVFFTPVLTLIPLPVLYGVFLYMGVSSLKGSQFFDRILILLMPQKYQPDYVFLRHVPTLRVHLFTLAQLTCLLVVMIGVRKLLDFVFTQRELKILDDVMPESTRRKHEEERMQEEQEQKVPIYI
ncbi:SLC4A7 [Cordylochernes scorpioides]|uniref:Anion exchange protein n=1 Tax=Cordylochernes scorpioides TaxID=51811 RepID=A0ABY6KEQ9_9ARAC|nr:SLC4A7 [Cordylochernes scorpioides]